MIPKIIHWCWLSEKWPKLVNACLQSWRLYADDYEIVRWDLEKSDLKNTPKWCQIAYDNKLYAFCSDYIRAKALYENGGIYLDSDVYLCNKDPFKNYEKDRFWIPMEFVCADKNQIFEELDEDGYNKTSKYIYGISVNPVFIGSEAKHPFMKDIMDFYWSLDDNYALEAKADNKETFIAPHAYSKVMEKYGLRYKNEEQFLNQDIHILDNSKFNHVSIKEEQLSLDAIHICAHSWKK